MIANIAPILSLISQRIVPVTGEAPTVSPTGRGTVLKRYREGLIQFLGLRAELHLLGYSEPQILQAHIIGELERDYDLRFDRLAAIKERYLDGSITASEMEGLVLELVPDVLRAPALADLWRAIKAPRLKAPTPATQPALTVAQLLAAFGARVLTRAALAGELTERRYTPEDAEILIRLQEARAPRPTAAEIRDIPLSDLRAMLALGQVTAAAYRAELVSRDYAPADADALLALEQARIAQRLAPPAPPELLQLPIADLKALYLLGYVDEADVASELRRRDWEPAAIEAELILLRSRRPHAPL